MLFTLSFLVWPIFLVWSVRNLISANANYACHHAIVVPLKTSRKWPSYFGAQWGIYANRKWPVHKKSWRHHTERLTARATTSHIRSGANPGSRRLVNFPPSTMMVKILKKSLILILLSNIRIPISQMTWLDILTLLKWINFSSLSGNCL